MKGEIAQIMNIKDTIKKSYEKTKVFVKKHKVEIIIVSGTVVAVVGAALIWKNRESIIDYFESLLAESEKSVTQSRIHTVTVTTETTIENYSHSARSIPVNGHTRSLPLGHNASAQQIEYAEIIGIELPDKHTYVRPYNKCA